MSIARHLRTALTIGAFSLVAVSPALAQGKGNGNGNGKGNGQQRAAAAQQERQRPTLQLRTDRNQDRYEDERDDRYGTRSGDRYESRSGDRYEDIRYDDRRDTRRNVPPGWCIGRGNPHNTPENCGYSRSRGVNDRYDDRYDGNSRSYAEAHTAFHRQLDRKYAELASQRRNDPIYQIRLRSEKANEHQRWHERNGTRH